MNLTAKSIVILPFKNDSSEKDNEFLCDGIAEELIGILSKMASLRVISRKSSFTFKDQSPSVDQLKKDLAVDFILEGSVKLRGDKIRVNTELIDVESKAQIWCGKWDRKVESIFDLEDEIALLISDQLREHVGHFEIGEKPVYRQKLDFEVYQKLLEAKALFYRWNPTDVERSIHLFKSVLEASPNNVDALVGLSDAYSFMATTNFMNPHEAWDLSEEYTEAARKLNPNHAGVNYLKSHSAFFTKGNFTEALAYAHKAVELNPAYPEALQFLSFFYTLALKKEIAKEYLDNALMLDPLNQETLFFKALFDYRFGQYEEAIQQYDGLIQQNPYNLPAIVSKSYALIKTKRYDENLQFIDSISPELLIPDERLGLICVTEAAKGSSELDIYLPKLKIAANDPYGMQAKCYLYWTYCLTNRLEEAFQLARNMMNDRISLILIHFADPVVEEVFSSSEFKELFKALYPIGQELKPTKPSKVLEVPNEELEKMAALIQSYIEESEAFLNPKLSLRALASSVEIHPNQLSLVLNSVFVLNFNAFVNNYRIDYFKKLVKNQDSSNYSLIGLAYESGFNSKTVFNTYFKKVEGITPGEYLKKH